MNSKFGMFIHWGIYAQIGYHEQVLRIMEHDVYEKYAETFNPTEYDPEEWVLLAKRTGMKYICITAKHHDGFCMWDTKFTDYKITNTPYGKDVLKMLADACKKHGMLLSLYYSCPDWHYEYGYNPNSSHQWKAKNQDHPDTEKLRVYIKLQIEELMSNYGPIYTLFWDIPPKIVDRSINEMVRKLQPYIYINDRGFDEGDFSTPEREFANLPNVRFAKATEACNSVGENSWGYKKDETFYSANVMCSNIHRIMAMGGSYLLNVGPDDRGVITKEYVKKLEKIGNWYNRMEGCLEDNEPEPFDYEVQPIRGSINPHVVTRKNGKTYFHFYQGLISDHFRLKNWPSMPKSARLLNTGSMLDFAVTSRRMDEPELLDIYHIPVDDTNGEPLVIEVEWS